MTTHLPNAPVSIETKRGVVVETYPIDDSSWAWGTLANLVPALLSSEQNPGRDQAISIVFKMIMDDAVACGLENAFGNPVYRVTSERPTSEFMEEARKSQNAWFRRAKDMLGSSGRVQRELNQMTPIIRQLSHTGILIINGEHVLPHDWPDRRNERKRRDLKGHRFGRLTVLRMMKRSSCRCRCDCGEEKTVRRSHLVKGATKSCGCLRAEFEARIRKRKESRR